MSPIDGKEAVASKHPDRTRKIPLLNRILVALAICICALWLLNFLAPAFGRRGYLSSSRPDDDQISPLLPDPKNTHTPEPFKPDKRYDLDTGSAACWPSKGGVWIKNMTPVELEYLGVDRFNNVERSSDPTDEDAFCKELRSTGAQFYNLPPEWPEGVSWCEELDFCVEPVEKLQMELGFTTGGGIWLLDTRGGYEQFGPGMGGLRNALTMDERCRVIEGLGGKFCENMTACPETAKLVD